ncbi:hypothetical protein K2173_018947 [Erythroxylum novogranatense]|uniref:Uncharacterized protein n=1 Tax=Erythroxylum novogranatense TaxID=1862640 RepID=A0AAV8ST14_9ROSI|nr:hypothetical protein K2173_018947 [Erythroxylum novogranatense]
MKFWTLAWFVLILFTLSKMALGEYFNLSSPVTEAKFQGLNVNGATIGGVESKEKYKILHSIKEGRKARGTYGSANINHDKPRSSNKGATPVSAWPSIVVSICIALGVILASASMFPLPAF